MSWDQPLVRDAEGRFTDDQGRVWRPVVRPPVWDMTGTMAEIERLIRVVRDVFADSDTRIDAHEKALQLLTLVQMHELPDAEDATYEHEH